MSEETITIDEVDYVIEDMSAKAKQYLVQVQKLTKKSNKIQNKLQRCEVARVGFVSMLKEELENE